METSRTSAVKPDPQHHRISADGLQPPCVAAGVAGASVPVDDAHGMFAKGVGGGADTSIVNLQRDGCAVSDDVAAAMDRGLRMVGAPPDVSVIATSDLVSVVELLEPDSGTYTVERGPLGEVAAKTIHENGTTTIVVGPSALARPIEDIERLLAHEGGHAVLHAADEATPKIMMKTSTTGPAILRGFAAICLDEHRIERRLAELGYPIAEHGDDETLREYMFAVPVGLVNACMDPRSSGDTLHFAHSVLQTIQPLTISMAYRLGAVSAGGDPIRPGSWPPFEQSMWNELVARNWRDRAELYASVPPAGQSWGGSVAATHLRKAAEIERRLVRDVGFTVSGDVREGSSWAFRRVVHDQILARWMAQLEAESNRA